MFNKHFTKKHHLVIDWETNQIVHEYWAWHRNDKTFHHDEAPDISHLFTKERIKFWGSFIDTDEFSGAEDEPHVDLSDEQIHWPKLWSDISISDRLSL